MSLISTNDFIRRNTEIDQEIKKEKLRHNQIIIRFKLLDVLVIVAIYGSSSYLQYKTFYEGEQEQDIALALEFLNPVLSFIIALLLVISACYMTRLLKISTGKKQNICILAWHIVNLFVLTMILIPKAIFRAKYLAA